MSDFHELRVFTERIKANSENILQIFEMIKCFQEPLQRTQTYEWWKQF